MKIVALLLASAAVAHADPKTAADLYAQGQEAYQAKNFAVAATKFVEAFSEDPDPVYLFNAAQAYRFGNDCKQSAEYYRRFLAKVPNPPNADKIKVWYDDMQICAKAREIDRQPHTPANTSPVVEPVPQPPPHDDEPKTNKLRLASYGTIGLGAVALGAAAYFGVQGASARDDREAICPPNDCTWDPAFAEQLADAESRGEAANKRAYISLVAGGVLLAGGVAMFLLSSDSSDERVALVPIDRGGLLVGALRF